MLPDHQLDMTFAALADPTRRAILARLSLGEANVSELAKPFLKTMSLPGVTKHLKMLENAGLVMKGRDKQMRPCMINADVMKEAAEWMEQYRVFWEASFDRLEEYLKTVTAPPSPRPRPPRRARGHVTQKGKHHDNQTKTQ